jgi:adenylosuccinate synthase
MTLDVVVGGLYGSEAKGHVTQRLVAQRLTEVTKVWNLRVGGPNAGHTGHDPGGEPWAFRQVPVGVLLNVPPGTHLGLEIAAGSEVDLPVLLDEVDRCTEAGLLGPGTNKSLVVHGEATLITDDHKVTETGLVGQVGSTGKGIGAARAARLLRQADRVIDSDVAWDALDLRGIEVVTGTGQWRETGSAVVIEGVQGYALGLHAGHYPQCTTSDCRAIDFLSMAGISPWDSKHAGPGRPMDLKVWVVARVFPIRVAGNSGPMQGETSWAELGLPEERTTVTKKVRRVGAPDWDLVRQAVAANGGPPVARVALSMMDQFYPEVRDLPWSETDPRWERAEKSIRALQDEVGAPISMVLSGPNTGAFR